jgi:hypothetical protein
VRVDVCFGRFLGCGAGALSSLSDVVAASRRAALFLVGSTWRFGGSAMKPEGGMHFCG